MFLLSQKSAVITGGGSGIGEAIAILFAERGAIVHIVDLNMAAAEQVAGKIQSSGGSAYAYGANIAVQEQVRQIFGQIKTIDILVNNAGVAHIGKADTTTEEDFDRVCSVNIKGVYNCLHEVIPMMKTGGGGAIVNMASIAALVGLPDRFLYSLTKAAVWNMTMTVAKDYIHDHIRCNSISPARVHTPFVDNYLKNTYPGREQEMYEVLSKTQPIGRMATPAEVANLALFLCSEEAAFITGCDYPLDGGFIKLNTD
jgi:NAD(P)-dependent dehydrogenase (short-subunit alcohol dehydrogenase family)